MRALITGGYGFAGRHLARHLIECGDDVAVTYLPNSGTGHDPKSVHPAAEKIVGLPTSVQSMALDITDPNAVKELLTLLQPDAIYHLAGLSVVPDGEKDWRKVMDVNAFGVSNMLDAVTETCKHAKFLCVSSAEVYGEPKPGTLPLTEKAELRPVTSYGVAKATADVAAFKYAFREGLNLVRVRPFPHAGPGQSDRFALSSFAKQVAQIKLGQISPIIEVGNLEVKRDYSDVSDIVRGYREALLNGKRGDVYNLCSGQSVEIGEVLQRLIAIAEVEVEVQEDPERVRPIDISDMCGSYERAQKHFGWKPRIDLEGTLHSLFAYWTEVLMSG